MRLIRPTPDATPEQGMGTVTALGFFDGVHLGHRRLLEAAVTEAAARGLVPAVFTFSDDVRSVKPGASRLTDFESKLRLLEEAGIELVYAADFSALSSYPPETFVREVLVSLCRTELAVCGFNFRFGRGASGDAEQLRRLMRGLGREARIIDPAYLGDRVISSSAIRLALESGEPELAAAMLGRPFSLTAPVLRGRGFGHTEGVPTVNQVFRTSGIVPKSGVYASRVILEDGRAVQGVSNVGVCPTFFGESGDLRCETHLIDYGEDLYGKTLSVQFCKYLRSEKKFETVDELYEQIRCDVKAAREIKTNP